MTRRVLSLALALAAVGGCTCRESIEVQLVSPAGPLEARPSQVRFVLSRPLFDPDHPLPTPPAAAVTVRPPVAFSVQFPTPSTVEVRFAGELAPAADYEVVLEPGLLGADGRSELKKAAIARFRTPLNRVERVSATGLGWSSEAISLAPDANGTPVPTGRIDGLGPGEALRVGFRYAVTAEQARALVKVFVKDGRPVPVKLELAPDPGSDLVITPDSPWPRDTQLVLSVGAGLKVAGVGAGPLATRETQAFEVHTWRPLALRSGPPDQAERCVTGKTVELAFNNPVSCERAREAMAASGGGTVKCVTSTESRTIRVEITPTPAPEGPVTLSLRPGLADLFGQTLGKSVDLTYVRCPGDAPQFALQKPFVILDPGLAAEHVERVFNASAVRVEGRRVTLAQLWSVIGAHELGDQVAWTELPWWLTEPGASDWYEGDLRRPGELRGKPVPELDGAQAVTVPVENGAEAWRDVVVGLEQFLQGNRGLALLRLSPVGAKNLAAAPALRIVNVTDIGLTVRASASTMVVLAASYATGKPLEGVALSVLSEKGEVLGSARTGVDGTATLPAATLQDVDSLHQKKLLVAAKKGDDEAFVWSRFVTEEVYGEDAPQPVGVVFPDRGIYKPGETVHLKAIVRIATAQGLANPAGQAAQLRVYDAEGGDFSSTDLTLGGHGTHDHQLVLPRSARLGYWRAELKLGASAVSGRFLVGEFRRAEMKVEIQTAPHVKLGETLKATIQGDYLFGAPAAGLAVQWSVTRTAETYESARFPEARFDDPARPEWSWSEGSSTKVLADGTAELDAKGTFLVAQRLRLPSPVSQRERIGVTAQVDDANGQSVTRAVSADLFGAEVLAGVMVPKYLVEADSELPITVVAVTPDDRAAADVPVVVRTRQTSWRSVRRAGPGGGFYWSSERVVEDDVVRCRGRTGEDGRFSCTMRPRQGGSLQIVAAATDAKGRTAEGSSWHWVWGDKNYWGDATDSPRATVLFERGEVEAGTPAKVAITSPFKQGVALVTVEREDILWQKSFEIGTSATLEIPTFEGWAPNVYVVATVVRGRLKNEGAAEPDPEREKPAYAIGRKELQVKPKRARVEVSVAVARPRLEPAEEQRATVSVVDREGRPVADAEVTLWAVDEGVLMLTGYETPDPIAGLFERRGWRTLGLDTRGYVLGRRVFVEPVRKGEEEGGGGGDENDSSLRRNFNPLAVWVGAKTTDSAGRVEATFKVPDSLTTYRVMAVAVTKDDRFGRADTQFKVNKTLMMRQALSRFVRPGDAAKVGVLLNQTTPDAGKVTVRLEAVDEKRFAVRGPRERELELRPNETVPVLFDLVAADAEGASELRFSAKMGEFGDRVELLLPVVRLTPRESVMASGVVSSGVMQASLAVPPQARPLGLEVSVSGYPLAALEGRLRDVVSYPYGCLEQRTSRILPLVAVRRLAEELRFKAIPSEKIEGWVEEWVTLVPKYRCDDGGFDYWPGCRWGSSTYLSAFALEGLLTARRFGYEVPEPEIQRTVDYLQRQLRAGSDGSDEYGHTLESSTGALRVLAEAGRPEPDIEQAAWAGRASLPLFAKADLARAMAFRLGTEAKANADIRTLVAEMGAGAKAEADRLTFPASDEGRYWWAWDSSQRNTAMFLRALVQVAPDDGRVPLLVRGLVELDRADPYYVTQSVTQTLLGLAEALPAMKSRSGGAKATVRAGTQQLAKNLAVGAALETFPVDPSQLVGQVPLEVANTGTGPLFFGASLTYAYPSTVRLPARAAGFVVNRKYLDSQGNPLPVRRDGGRASVELRVGELVSVHVTLNIADDGRLVVVDDPLPAGLEAVNAQLATTNQEALRRMGGQRPDWWTAYHRELRDDRVEWHFEHVWKGALELDYVARATTAGTFHAPGTHAERMYQPQLNGRAEALDVTVLPKGR
jgi:hypothetical protein